MGDLKNNVLPSKFDFGQNIIDMYVNYSGGYEIKHRDSRKQEFVSIEQTGNLKPACHWVGQISEKSMFRFF